MANPFVMMERPEIPCGNNARRILPSGGQGGLSRRFRYCSPERPTPCWVHAMGYKIVPDLPEPEWLDSDVRILPFLLQASLAARISLSVVESLGSLWQRRPAASSRKCNDVIF